jgi:hypothetical protein
MRSVALIIYQFYPGALYMLSMFYTRKEIATRMSIFYTGNMLSSAFAGLIAAGVFSGLGGKFGLAGWQWFDFSDLNASHVPLINDFRLFIIEGSISIFVAFIAFFFLPDSPLKTRWLTADERQLAHDRIFADTTDRRHGETSVWKGFREACSDYRTWIFCLMDNLHLSANGFKNFLPTLVEAMGFDTTSALALTCPPYIFAGIISIAVSWSSGRFNERTWHITASKAVAIVGFAICVGSLNKAARYVGVMLFVGATYGVNNIVLGWTSSVLGQSDEKKAVALALCNTFGNLASVYTPYLWPDTDWPRFGMAMGASIGFSGGVVVCAWIMRLCLQRTNRHVRESDPAATNFYVY